MGEGEEVKRTTPTVDPNAPAGGGGPGYFREPFSLNEDGSPSLSIAHPKGPSARLWVAQAKTPSEGTGTTPTKVKAPPVTKPSTSDVKKESNKEMDIDVKVKILADRKSSKLRKKAAKTSFNFKKLTYNYPNVDLDRKTKTITKIKSKYIFKGYIPIQTLYGKKAKAKDKSVYGRGTTKADKSSGNITLGFHESCHRQDYLDYLKDNPLPKFKKIKIGDSKADYLDAIQDFKDKLEQYRKDMNAESVKNTDEVGYKLSKCKVDGKCK